MELSAAIKACKCAEHIKGFNEEVIIYSDSAYLINCCQQNWYKAWMSNGWFNSKGEPIANKKLWQYLIEYFQNDNYSFQKVKGHSIDCFNNMVDALATGKISKGD